MFEQKRRQVRSSQTDILKLPYLVLIVSILLTIGATYIFYKNEESKDYVRFHGEVGRCNNIIESKLRAYIGLLKASRGFIESNNNLNKKSFRSFLGNLEFQKNYSEVKEIGFSKRINPADRQIFLKDLQAEGYPNFKIFPESQKEESFPIVYSEPADGKKFLEIGFDMTSNPEYQKTMEKARDSGENTATGKISFKLPHSEVEKVGFLIFMPVYRDGEMPATAEDRKSLLSGYIYNFIEGDELLKSSQKTADVPDVLTTIYEDDVKPDNIFVQSESFSSGLHDGVLNEVTEIKAADKKWIVAYQTLPNFTYQSSKNWTPIIFITGAIFSLLLFGMTYLESSARVKAERITKQLQASEREKGFLLEREQKERFAAEESSKAKDNFISIVSHELRTPLNSIAGWAKILHTKDLNEEIKNKALNTIDKNIRVQTRIVEDLLDLSQILSSNQHFVKTEVNLSKIFDDVVQEFQETAEKKKINLMKENSLNGQKFYGDHEKLKKVFRNLLYNAIKFTEEGGKVFAELKEENGNIKALISDTGKGIEPQFLQHIFEIFKQADSSTTRIHGGLGLGLAIVKQIVELHGGKISAESEGEEKGTTFTIRFPIKLTEDYT